MAIFYVLNPAGEKIGLLENYNSVQWREDYNNSGYLEIHATITDQNFDLLKVNNIIRNGSSVADIIAIQYRDEDIIAYGKMAGDRLRRRVILRTENITNVETSLRSIFTRNARNCGLTLGAAAGLTETVSSQVTGGSVLDAFIKILAASGLGWRVDTDLSMRFYKGVDRRSGQPGLVGVLSDAADTVEKVVFTGDIDKFYNVAVIAGEGEGTARVWTSAWIADDEPTGTDRRELFVDARDLSSVYQIEGDPTEYTYTPAEYLEILKARGREKLAESLFESKFTADVIDGNMTFGTDYNLGDIMPVKLVKYGVSFSARVVSATRIYEKDEKVLVKVEKI